MSLFIALILIAVGVSFLVYYTISELIEVFEKNDWKKIRLPLWTIPAGIIVLIGILIIGVDAFVAGLAIFILGWMLLALSSMFIGGFRK